MNQQPTLCKEAGEELANKLLWQHRTELLVAMGMTWQGSPTLLV